MSTDTVPRGRAAVALELKRGEFELAVQLGHVRTAPGGSPGRRRVPREEITRLREAVGFPEVLRERVRTLGSVDAARLVSTTAVRFTGLARTGHLTPVRLRLNRYRAVVWLYLASEVREFADRNPDLLVGKLPSRLRAGLDEGEDWRARNWRGRHLGTLLRLADDPWARAAAIASLLDASPLAEVVDDPHERAYLERLRPERPFGRTESSAVREITDRLLLAEAPEEILWHRMSLTLSLDEARASRPAPRPATGRLRPGAPSAGGPLRPHPRDAPPGVGRDGPPGAGSGRASGALPRPRSVPESRTGPEVRALSEARPRPEARSRAQATVPRRSPSGGEAAMRLPAGPASRSSGRPRFRADGSPRLPSDGDGDGAARHRAPSGRAPKRCRPGGAG
ncbi:DUF6397 family protein [Streptomyces sp. HNM0645]|uniref:DUF6397 family protein n=1 Tax=Streptomyces sp. HNM0645 TaxID=2782343 RepID=UPI0024B700BA|nr:DUF6397 family protein [Streptomyces sp. HNM0645]MDI9883751.1 DUF6397 family protein [Streptomyces sp. HNM0645]